MALGSENTYGNNGNNKKVFDPTYYSRIRIKNRDKKALDFNYSRGLLKVILSEERDNYRYEDMTYITISPTKARLLIDQLETFIGRMKSGEPIDPKEGVGINSGIGETVNFLIFKVTGNRPDVPEHSIVMGKISQNGIVECSYEFVFNVDYDFSLHWRDVDSMDVEKQIDQFMGIKMFLGVLKEFANSSSGAIGASVWDTGRYEVNRLSKKIDPIYNKLGIEISHGNRERDRADMGSASENFFTRQSSSYSNQNSQSNHKSYTEIEGILSDDEYGDMPEED